MVDAVNFFQDFDSLLLACNCHVEVLLLDIDGGQVPVALGNSGVKGRRHLTLDLYSILEAFDCLV